MTDSDLIDQIQAIRAKNNELWMGYVRLAFKHAPDEARAIQRSITAYDREISAITDKLSQ